ncbi:Peptidase family M23 [Alkalispirochaeta americana]|uniref:Peptidase family M23 n=1 Tax=Alkalispirochaeta americana TaxID=159291 RepID=A0A1N6W2C5_9SPIO|nr:M23 family metallopeptidase [Alkalispirochaeta americana]SIQ84277.1 Peptidase family M23 [Alkalispirochaeta americana]
MAHDTSRKNRRIQRGPGKGGWRFRKILTQRFTIMLIPHSERSVFNFQISLVSLGTLLLAGLFLVASFLYLSSVRIGTGAMVESQAEEISQSQVDLETTIREIQKVLRVAHAFDEEMVDTLNSLGVERHDAAQTSGVTRGDLAEFSDLQVVADDRAREIQDLRNLSERLGDSLEPLREIQRVLRSREELLSDIPNLWPVGGGVGRVLREFGPNIHPITGAWYIHKGTVIAAPPGSPVVASANGRVVEMGYDPEYGLYVYLRHKYGFRTRYSHLQRVAVREGQDLLQGEEIGSVGNSGLSPEPGLDFVVKIGTDVVDPAAFLKIRSRLDRRRM